MGRNLHENGQTALQTWQREPRAQIDEHEWLSFLVEWHAHEILAHLACSIPAVLIRIPCIFNVLKANQLFPFPFCSPFIHFLSFHLLHAKHKTIFFFCCRTRRAWKLISDSSGVPLLAAMLIANVAARTRVIRVCAHSNWRQQQREDEANERRRAARKVSWLDRSSLHHQPFIFSLKI